MCGCSYQILCNLNASGWHAECAGADAVHNHEQALSTRAHPSLRKLTDEQKDTVKRLRSSGLKPAAIQRILQDDGPGTLATLQDIKNVIKRQKTEFLAGRSPTQALLLDELVKAGVPCVPKIEDDGTLTHLMIAPSGQTLLSRFADVLLLDCTYKTNMYNLPVLEVVGVTAAHTSFTAACFFMSGETEPDYAWAQQQLLLLLGGRQPGVVLTDKDQALTNAIARQMPTHAPPSQRSKIRGNPCKSK